MFSVTFVGFKTIEQAKVFAEWYSGQGEQDSSCWMEEHSDASFVSAEEIEVLDSENKVVVRIQIS